MKREEKKIDIAVIGGGASGLAAAISAAKLGTERENPLHITILERQDRVAKKLLATGNGRCNFTNIGAEERNYHGRDVGFMIPAMTRFNPLSNIHFFCEMGILPRYEEEGKVYPYSGQASSMVDVLRITAARWGVHTITDCRVDSLRKDESFFHIKCGDQSYRARRIIMATGGMAAPDLGGNGSGYKILTSLGHAQIPLFPSLVQIKTENTLPRALKGIKCKGDVTLKNGSMVLRREHGEILFTEYGLSGPPILQISRCLAENQYENLIVEIDFFPEFSKEKLFDLLKERRRNLSHLTLEHYLTGMINKKTGQLLLKRVLGSPLSRSVSSLNDDDLKRILRALKEFGLAVVGALSWKNAQVTAGGIDTRDFDDTTMESRIVPGLYCCGEVLDIDGDCGGYNLQWAWASGRLAGESAAFSLEDDV